MVGIYINTMKTTFLFKFLLLTTFFRITSLQVTKEKGFLIESFTWLLFLCYHAVLQLEINQSLNRKSSSYIIALLYCKVCIYLCEECTCL